MTRHRWSRSDILLSLRLYLEVKKVAGVIGCSESSLIHKLANDLHLDPEADGGPESVSDEHREIWSEYLENPQEVEQEMDEIYKQRMRAGSPPAQDEQEQSGDGWPDEDASQPADGTDDTHPTPAVPSSGAPSDGVEQRVSQGAPARRKVATLFVRYVKLKSQAGIPAQFKNRNTKKRYLYWPVLKILKKEPGKTHVNEIKNRLVKRENMDGKKISTKHNLGFTGTRLVQEGLALKDRRGNWKLTPEGREILAGVCEECTDGGCGCPESHQEKGEEWEVLQKASAERQTAMAFVRYVRLKSREKMPDEFKARHIKKRYLYWPVLEYLQKAGGEWMLKDDIAAKFTGDEWKPFRNPGKKEKGFRMQLGLAGTRLEREGLIEQDRRRGWRLTLLGLMILKEVAKISD